RWDVTSGPGSAKGSWGGHYVYIPGYTPDGPVCVTWGRKQQMTWAWFDKYCDEAYGIFDAKDHFKKTMIDKKKISSFLKRLCKSGMPAFTEDRISQCHERRAFVFGYYVKRSVYFPH